MREESSLVKLSARSEGEVRQKSTCRSQRSWNEEGYSGSEFSKRIFCIDAISPFDASDTPAPKPLLPKEPPKQHYLDQDEVVHDYGQQTEDDRQCSRSISFHPLWRRKGTAHLETGPHLSILKKQAHLPQPLLIRPLISSIKILLPLPAAPKTNTSPEPPYHQRRRPIPP